MSVMHRGWHLQKHLDDLAMKQVEAKSARPKCIVSSRLLGGHKSLVGKSILVLPFPPQLASYFPPKHLS